MSAKSKPIHTTYVASTNATLEAEFVVTRKIYMKQQDFPLPMVFIHHTFIYNTKSA